MSFILSVTVPNKNPECLYTHGMTVCVCVCCVCSVVSHGGSFTFGIVLCPPTPSPTTQAHIQKELHCCQSKHYRS